MGAFHSIRTGQISAFERYMAQLESFYQSCVRSSTLTSTLRGDRAVTLRSR